MSKSVYKDMMDQVRPNNELILKTKRNMVTLAEGGDATRQQTVRWKPKLVMVLVAAFLVAVFATTAIAYGNEIGSVLRQIIFGDSSVNQIYDSNKSQLEIARNEMSDGIVVHSSTTGIRTEAGFRFEIIGRSVDPAADSLNAFEGIGEYEGFATVDEANRYAPFTIAEPSNLPEGAVLELVKVYCFEDSSLSYDATLRYNIEYDILDENNEVIGSGVGSIHLIQRYAGPDAFIEGTVEYPLTIEKSMVGDSEAIIINSNLAELADMEDDIGNKGLNMTIIWLKKEVYYELFASLALDICDRDMLIAIAESIG
ncbi:MAG: DUF4367 domain-containing protein [Oscillospiraceae bacterium]|jgi:hypothetical protein|nr:DUF4367 domain-containing protein [Oscillospiraceae bacterium]